MKRYHKGASEQSNSEEWTDSMRCAAVPVWQPAPVQPRGHRHLFQRIQVPPWAHGGEHVAEIHITLILIMNRLETIESKS